MAATRRTKKQLSPRKIKSLNAMVHKIHAAGIRFNPARVAKCLRPP